MSAELPLVVVTEPEFRRAESTFRSTAHARCVSAPPGEDELAAAIRGEGAAHAIVGPRPYRGEAVYASLSRGAVLARFGVGFDGLDLAKATAAGVLCTNTPDVLTQSVAEHAMALVAAAARSLPRFDREMRGGRWQPEPGVELAGKTLVVVGCGRIGRAFARIAARGFGMRVVGYRRAAATTADSAALEDFDRVTDNFAEAVRDAAFVSLHMPGSPENVRFLNHDRLALLPPGAWVINTARGTVVNEAVLFDALSRGRIAGAALDVFDREPYEPADPSRDLRTLPNVILVPHTGSNTVDANRRMAERALGNVALALAGAFNRMDLLNPGVMGPGRPPRA